MPPYITNGLFNRVGIKKTLRFEIFVIFYEICIDTALIPINGIAILFEIFVTFYVMKFVFGLLYWVLIFHLIG